MANPDAAFGLRPVRHVNGAPWNGATMECFVPATDSTVLGVGDPVKLAGSADTLGLAPTVARAAAGDAIFGVVTSVKPARENSETYRVASTATYVNVCVDDGSIVYHIQEDSVGGDLAATNVGNVADIIVANADTNTGLSQVELDSSDAAASGSAQLRILRLADPRSRGENAIGTNAVWEVVINERQLADGGAGV